MQASSNTPFGPCEGFLHLDVARRRHRGRGDSVCSGGDDDDEREMTLHFQFIVLGSASDGDINIEGNQEDNNDTNVRMDETRRSQLLIMKPGVVR